jgi:hypothetical protein
VIVTLAVTGNTIYGRVVWRRVLQVFEWLRLLLTGSLRDIRWLSGRGKTPTLCLFPVFSEAVMESVVTLAVTGKYYSGRVLWRQWVLVSREHRLPFRPEVVGRTVAERSWKDADFVCISLYLAWRLCKSVVTLAVTGNTISGRVVWQFRRCRCLGSIDCRGPEVDGTCGG